MASKIESPGRIHKEVHFKTLSSKNNDEKSETSLGTEGSTQAEIDRSVENILPNSQMVSTGYFLSSQEGKKKFFNAAIKEEIRFKRYITLSVNFLFINSQKMLLSIKF